VARYAREVDGRVRLIPMNRNGGPYVARNRALADARGAYFTCNDADDWAHPDKLSILVEALEGEDSPVAVQSRLVRLSAELGLKPRREGYVHTDLSSTLFRREVVVQRIGFYEAARFGADSEYLARLQIAFGNGAIRRVPKPLLVSDWADNTLTSASSTGITDGGIFSPRRAAYRDAYRARHARGEGLLIDRSEAGLEP
jgi:glycosyltransferase involved in cell wall biosynthesis